VISQACERRHRDVRNAGALPVESDGSMAGAFASPKTGFRPNPPAPGAGGELEGTEITAWFGEPQVARPGVVP